jgi:hypothetical protein
MGIDSGPIITLNGLVFQLDAANKDIIIKPSNGVFGRFAAFTDQYTRGVQIF